MLSTAHRLPHLQLGSSKLSRFTRLDAKQLMFSRHRTRRDPIQSNNNSLLDPFPHKIRGNVYVTSRELPVQDYVTVDA